MQFIQQNNIKPVMARVALAIAAVSDHALPGESQSLFAQAQESMSAAITHLSRTRSEYDYLALELLVLHAEFLLKELSRKTEIPLPMLDPENSSGIKRI
ncbi:MAG TPA: hypothetical protein V6C81_13320 [Planktothrix sp.]|jgi:hypothetical protein